MGCWLEMVGPRRLPAHRGDGGRPTRDLRTSMTASKSRTRKAVE